MGVWFCDIRAVLHSCDVFFMLCTDYLIVFILNYLFYFLDQMTLIKNCHKHSAQNDPIQICYLRGARNEPDPKPSHMWGIKWPFKFLYILTFIAEDILVCFASDVKDTIISFHWKDLSVKGELKYAKRIWKTRTKAKVYVHLSNKVDKSWLKILCRTLKRAAGDLCWLATPTEHFRVKWSSTLNQRPIQISMSKMIIIQIEI